ncbi:MAG: glycoside hydrolase family 31 protein [Sphingomonas sp.]
MRSPSARHECVRLTALGALAIGFAAPASAAALAQTADTAAPAQAAARFAARNDGVDVHRGTLMMRVTALTDSIMRVRIAPHGSLPEDASWAVPANVRARHVAVTATPDGFATDAMRVHIDPQTLGITVTDPTGKVIVADADRPIRLDGSGFTLAKQLPEGEHIFGLGDKTGGDLDRRGHSYVDWNTDAYGFDSSTDPIYKSIPFFIGVGAAGGSYGILFDNSWRAWFDFGHKTADELTFGAPGGPIDYYVIAGPSTAQVVRQYTDLTGKPPLPPQWALGYQQSRYSYMSADEVRQIVDRFRKDDFPLDVVWLDIDYQDRNRPFTVNTKTFPDMKGLIGDLDKQGVKVVTITDLHVADLPNQNYAPYDSGMAGDHFVHNPDGSVYVAPVWPGPSVFPDFTDAKTRTWWGSLFKGEVADGVAGVWNDMNEPAIFETPTKTMPLDTVHHIDSDGFAPRDASHREIHNVYGMENSRATYDGLKTLRPDERAFVMTRASYAGGQRYAVTWTGDNSSSWDHLKLSVHQLINLGLSGFAYGAADVGGFTGGPSADLLTRWFEIATFTPVFRDHSAKDTPRAEPWVDGPQQLAIRRRFVDERYRLMPYLYALADHNRQTGDPLMRPVFYDYPAAISASCDQSMAFTLGADLLVAPPPKPESPQKYDVCLPAGGWYDYWTGLPAAASAPANGNQPVQSAAQTVPGASTPSQTIQETPALDNLPVFVRAGSILPRQPLVMSTADTPKGPLSLEIYPGDDCHGTIYADDGHTMAFEHDGYLRQQVTCRVTPTGMTIVFQARTGSYRPWWHDLAITVHGWQGAATIRADGHSAAGTVDAAAQTISFTVPDPAVATEITLNH